VITKITLVTYYKRVTSYNRYIHTNTHTHIYIYIYINIKFNHSTSFLFEHEQCSHDDLVTLELLNHETRSTLTFIITCSLTYFNLKDSFKCCVKK